MGYQNVLIGVCWEHGQYRVSFQKTIFSPKTQDINFQEVEIQSGYADKLAVFGRRQAEQLVSKPDDLKALSEDGKACSFFLLHRADV